MKKIFCIFIYILSISCTTNSNQFKQITDSKIIKNITANFNVEEPNEINTELIKKALVNWNSKGFFNKYKYWFLFLVVYFIVGYKIESKITDNIYDNRKTKTAYKYFIFSSLFGGHLIYQGRPWKYLFYSVLLLIFLYTNTFIISYFYNNSSVLIYTIKENSTSIITLSAILIILIFDFFTLPIQVFKLNKSFRDNITPKISQERQFSFLEIKSTLEKNNNLMLEEYNKWKK